MKSTSIIAATALVLASTPSYAQDRIADLEKKVEALSQEVERLKLGEAAAEPTATVKPFVGKALAPAASKVYRASVNKVSIGGYGEAIYNNYSKRRQDGDAAGVRDQADFVRLVLYAGYKFSDTILFNSELEFEHASTGRGRGEVSVEQAYVDFKLWEPFNARAGMVLVPMGFINEIHEPTAFHGANRPSVETNIIPATWRENGVGFFGSLGPVSYRSYVMTGLQATTNTGVTGFSSSSGLRNGRSAGAKSFAEDLSWVGRADYTPVEGVTVGASLYSGEADQGLAVHSVPVTLWEGHAQAEWRGAELRALYAQGSVGNADTVNALQGNTNAAKNSVGSKLFGGYLEGAFDVMTLTDKKKYLAPFVRYERYDTQADTPEAMAKNPANSRVEYTVGLTLRPIPQVAIKADHQWILNQARTGVNQFNLGLAYIF